MAAGPKTDSPRPVKVSSNHPFTCDKCPGSFTRKEHLLRHYRTHEQVKPYECSICGQNFGRKDLRDRHERNVHNTGRPSLVRAASDGPPLVSNEFVSTRKQSSFFKLTPEVHVVCLDNFFTFFAPSIPVIHRPTFNKDRRCPGLIHAMVAIGASFSDDPELRTIATQIYREEWTNMRQYFGEIRIEDARTFDILSEVVLLSMFCLAHLDQSEFPDCRCLLLESIQFARRFGIGRSLISTAKHAPETLHERWLEWIKYETFKRLALFFYIIDGVISSIFATAAHMSFVELKHNLPVDEVIWLANTSEQWQNACLSSSANTESSLALTLQTLLYGQLVPPNLNELSSVLLSTFLLNSICKHSSWKVLYPGAPSPESAVMQPPHNINGAQFSAESSARELQLKKALDALLDRTRIRRLERPPSILWDTTSIIQQMSYLRLYLPSAQARYGIPHSDMRMAVDEVASEIIQEDLGDIEYRPITLLLSWFIELMLSQMHLQHQDSFYGNLSATESSIGCSLLVVSMMEVWRLVRYTNLHNYDISQSQGSSLARQSFLSIVRELCQTISGRAEGTPTYVGEDELADVLRCVCRNMFQATGMGSFRLCAKSFDSLLRMLRNGGTEQGFNEHGPGLRAWEMITRTL